MPARFFERVRDVLVAGLIASNLVAPVVVISLWQDSVDRASMPEAPVQIDSDALSREHDIGCAT
jgi:hypothetical protein